MTTRQMIKPEVIPGFDVLKWKEETQAKIYEEIKDLSPQEVLEYFRKGAERFDEEQKRRRAELDAQQKAEEVMK